MISGQEAIETLDDLIEQHRKMHREIGNPDAPDDVNFTSIVYCYLDAKGWDIKRFTRELLHVSERMKQRMK
jgi:hypothetical protein